MQHIKLFEDFLNENLIKESQKAADALIDILSNMEAHHYSDDKEFAKDMIKIAGFKNSEASLLKDIFNKYWDLDAKKRTDYTAKDWAEWLKKSSHGWVFENSKLNESKIALGSEVLKNTNLFNEVVKTLLDYAKKNSTKYNLKVVTKNNLEKWLKEDADMNEDFDYLEDLDFTLSGFFEYMDN
jgi:hypothetical protein